MDRLIEYLLLAAVLSCTAVARADEPLRLSASSPWNLRYDEDKCRMIRKFGSGEQELTFMFDQAGVEPYYTLTLAGPRVRQANGKVMRVRFGDEQPIERSFLKGRLEDGTPLVAMFGVNLAPVPPLDPKVSENEAEVEPIGTARETAIEQIAVTGGLDNPVVLETGSLREPLAAMHKCAADLITYLGIAEDSKRKLSREPAPATNPGTWVGPNDYPRKMLLNDVEAVVRFRLVVDSRGTPTSCHITRSSRPQVFDDAVCLALLKRARFKPAQDLEGKPVAATWSSAVRWEVPG